MKKYSVFGVKFVVSKYRSAFESIRQAHSKVELRSFTFKAFDIKNYFQSLKRSSYVKFAIIILAAGLLFSPFGSFAANSFSASYDTGSLNADFGLGTVTAGTDGTPATLAAGYGGIGQAANITAGQTLKYPVAGNLAADKGSISLQTQLQSYLNGDSERGKFCGPGSVAYDSASGYFFVADTNNNRIVKTKIDGSGWVSFGTLGSGVNQFYQPYGISYDASTSYIYVSDSYNNRIVKTKIDGTGWTTYGTQGSGTGNFSNPWGINYDASSGYIYAVDSGNGRIVKTKIDGTGWTTYGSTGSGNGKFYYPRGIFYDSASGYSYVTDYNNSRIVKTQIDGTGWTSLGSYGTGTGKFSNPYGIFYDSASSNVYVADTGNNRIVKSQMDGTGWTSYGAYGSGIGGFSSPQAVVYDSSSGFMFVVDGNSHIVKTQFDGTGWTTYGSFGAVNAGMKSPSGVKYDSSSGFFYAIDSGNNRVIRMKADGTGWTTLGTYGTQNNNFNSPKAIDYDSSTGYLYVADTSNNRIVKTKIDGTGWQSLGGFSQPSGISYDPSSGYLYVGDSNNNRIVKTKIDGTGWTTFGSSWGGAGGFNKPGGVYYDPSSDYIYVADYNNSRVVKTKIDGTGWTTLGVSSPNGINYDSSSGYIYVASNGGFVLKTKIDGTSQTVYGSSGSGQGQFSSPGGVFYDTGSGTIYVADTSNNRIVSVNSGTYANVGSVSGTAGSRPGQLSSPGHFAYDPSSGYYYIADTNNNRIVKTKIDGTGWTAFGTYCSSSCTAIGAFYNPAGVAYDSSTGYLYITDNGNNRIVKTKIDGTGWTTYGTQGSGTGNFALPKGISYDSASGYIYVADYNNSRVVKTKIDGTGWTTYGTNGVGTGNFNFPNDIFYDSASAYLYIADSSNNRVVKTQIDGTGWTVYGTNGYGLGNFSGPKGIYYDSASNFIYVADSTNNRIVKTQIDGTGWKSFGTQGVQDGSFSSPSGIWYDSSSDTVSVTDSGNNRLIKTNIGGGWTTYGTSGTGTGNFNNPNGVYYDSSSGYVYIADTNNNRIVKTKIDGTGWVAYGTSGSGTGNFSGPRGIYYDSSSGYIYVADTGNNRIVKTQIDGTGWTTYGSYGSTTGKFNQPYDVKYDAGSSYLYVVDCGNNRIVKTQMNGTGWTAYGTSGSGLGNFNLPVALAFDAATGNIYVADYYNSRVVRTKIDGSNWFAYGCGTNSSVFPAGYLNGPSGIYFDSASSTIYVTTNGTYSNKVTKIKSDNSYVGVYGAINGVAGSGVEQFNSPGGVSYDAPSGYMYVSDSTNKRIVKVKMGGDNWQSLGVSISTVGLLGNITGVYYDSASDYYYIADAGYNRIVKTKIDGTGWTTLGGPISGPMTPAVDIFEFTGNCSNNIYYDASSGFIYVGNYGFITKTKIDGSGWTSYGSYGSSTGNFSYIGGIQYDSASGYLYVSDNGNNRIVKTKIDGTGWTSYGTYGTSGSGAGHFSGPKGLSFDSASGFIYVVDYSNNRIVKTQIDGTGWASYGSYGSGTGNFNNPYGVSYDPSSGFMYVADYSNNRIVKTKIDGTGWTTVGVASPLQVQFSASTGNLYISSPTRIIITQLNSFTNNSPIAPKEVLLQTQGDGMRLAIDPLSGRLTFWPAYNVDSSIFVQSAPLNWTGGSWHSISAWWNQPDGQLKLSVDGTEYVTTASWSLPSYGSSFYVGSDPNNTSDALGGSVDNLKILNIYQDNDMPTNPTGIHGYSSTDKLTEIADNSWHNYNSTGPYFEWTGAGDVGSGINGYYVYFGPNPSANPVTDGSFQMAASYQNTANLASGSSYYLRVAAQDNANHNASASTLFTYNFDSVAPSTPDHIAVDPAGCSYTEPYTFTWPASTDSGSQVASYEYKNSPTGDIQSTTHLTATATHYQDDSNFFYVRAKDTAGNVSGWQSAQYCYALDNIPPTNPNTASAINQDGGVQTLASNHWYNFAHPKFSWSGASDNIGVAGYYVYFGTNPTADPEEEGTYQTETSYIGSPGDSGSTYYLRIKAKDLANLVSTTAYDAFTYLYSTNVPSNPTTLTSLSATGSETTLNTDTWYNYQTPAFSWSGASGGQGVAGYYVYFGTNTNANPETDGSYQTGNSFTPTTSLNSGSTYYLKIKTKDQAGNPASDIWSPFSYKYDGTAPATPEYVTVAPVGCTTKPLFTMSWPASTDAESGLKTYEYKKGSQGNIIAVSDLTKDVSAYQDGDNIFYVRAKDNAGNTSSWQTGVFCSTGIVHITDGPNVDPGPSSITVSWTTSKPSTSSVKVFQGNSYISEQGQVSYDIFHKVKVIGLKSEEDYRYQLTWTDQNGNLGESEWFDTKTDTVPQVTNLKAEVQSQTKVNVSWQTNYPATSKIEFGLNNSYDSQVVIDNSGKDFSKLLEGLTPGSIYTLRVLATTADGAEFSSGVTFQTPPMPSISALKVDPITDQASATEKVSWTSNVDITSSLFYGIKGEADRIEKSTLDKAQAHEVTITDLTDNTEYELYTSGIDQYGNVAKSETLTFKTANDTRPPKILSISIETSNVGLGQEDKAQAAVSYKTDESTSCILEYAEGISGDSYTGKTPKDDTYSNSHLTVISELKPQQPYHLRIVCQDHSGNQTVSDGQTIISGEAPKSVFNIIVKTLSNIFGWLNLVSK